MLDTIATEISTIILTIMAVTLAVVTVHAWYLGNEKRDVKLLGAFSALFGAGAALTVVL